MQRPAVLLLIAALLASLGFNIFMVHYVNRARTKDLSRTALVFEDANSRDTYFSIHNVRDVHEITRGEGIKVGILDMFFGLNEHPELYTGSKDFSNRETDFIELAEHGYWMALTLKEIAPEAELFALGIDFSNEVDKTAQMIEAIDWAIEHDLDVLTYSSGAFSPEQKKQLDAAVEKAVNHNIVTTFIWYPHPDNILPGGLTADMEYDGREADLNILHYDYNTVRIGDYLEYAAAGEEARRQMMNPFMSYSSTAPVVAGFVALLKSINNELPPGEYKRILIETSRELIYNGEKCPRVADVGEAVKLIAGMTE
jgi:hypothetical protein